MYQKTISFLSLLSEAYQIIKQNFLNFFIERPPYNGKKTKQNYIFFETLFLNVCVHVLGFFKFLFFLLCGHPPIMPGFSCIPQGLGPFWVHHHIVYTCTTAPCTLFPRTSLLVAPASTFSRTAFLITKVYFYLMVYLTIKGPVQKPFDKLNTHIEKQSCTI